jgi:uncharacterized protein (TIGR01777 family)
MRIAVTGSTGLIGSALVRSLTAGGWHVTRLVRVRTEAQAGAADIVWHPESGSLNAGALDGVDAVVHLAGQSVATRWTPANKERILRSRVDGTRLLSQTLSDLDRRPQVLITASAIGYYGDRGEETLREDSPAGAGFLAEVCRSWEAATEPAREAGVRVAMMRLGIVLSPNGGALSKMLTPFRLGLGGRIGSGRQYWSWITLDDVVHTIHHVLDTPTLRGPVNVVSPLPVRNREFTRLLAKVLRRPAILPVPAFALRLLLGRMADEGLLASARVEPARLETTGYVFRYPELESALRNLLTA